MWQSFVRWCLALMSAVVVVVAILSLFTIFATPLKDDLSDYLLGHFGGGPPQQFDPDLPPLPPLPASPPESWIAGQPHCDFTITGRITQNDGAPIASAEVKIFNAGMFDAGDYRFTDKNGEFSYTELGVETCDKEEFYISISKNGFEPHFMIATPGEEIIISLTSVF